MTFFQSLKLCYIFGSLKMLCFGSRNMGSIGMELSQKIMVPWYLRGLLALWLLASTGMAGFEDFLETESE